MFPSLKLTLNSARVLEIADGRGIHHVPYDEALDGLVLRDKSSRRLTAHALNLQYRNLKIVSARITRA